MTIASKITRLQALKEAFREKINSRGVSTEGAPFEVWPSLIDHVVGYPLSVEGVVIDYVTHNAVALRVVATGGTEPYVYQWQQREDADGEWQDVADATDSSIERSNLAPETDYRYRVAVTDGTTHTVYSDEQVVTTLSAPTYRVAIIDNGTGPTKSNWPVQIKLDSTNWDFSVSDGSDIRITLDDGTTELSFWRESYDADTSTASIWVKVPSIEAGSTRNIRIYTDAAEDLTAPDEVFEFFEGFDQAADWLGTLDQASTMPVLANKVNVVTNGSPPWKEGRVREPGNIVYDPADPDPNGRYKLYFTGYDTRTAGATLAVGLAVSPDCETWHEYTGNPVAPEGEDPYVVHDGTSFHMFCEDRSNQNMLHYTSEDGYTWTADPANPVITHGPEGSWEAYSSGASPTVLWTGGQFVLLYEGWQSQTGPVFQTGVARSPDGSVWTKEPTNPVIPELQVPDEVWQDADGGWWVGGHQPGGSGYRRFYTTDDPADWVAGSFVEIGYPFRSRNITLVTNGGPMEFRKAVDTDMGTDDSVDVYDVLGGNRWGVEAVGGTISHHDRPVTIGERSEGGRGLRVVMPSSASNYGLGFYTRTLARTAGFAVGVRQSMIKSGTFMRKWGLGIGRDFFHVGQGERVAPSNGYLFTDSVGGTLGVLRYVDQANSTIASGQIAEDQIDKMVTHEARYTADGDFAYHVDGNEIVSGTDATYTDLEMEVLFVIGQTSNNGLSYAADAVYVRPYDGSDPVVTVGDPYDL